MATPKRHIGKITNTDQRCVVAMMEIPGAEGFALVVPTDALPPRYEQVVRELTESNEGQHEPLLANLFARRRMPDNGLTVLQTLHEGGWLVRVTQRNIVMLPAPNMPFPLPDVVKAMKEQGIFPRPGQTHGTPTPPAPGRVPPQRMELVEEADQTVAAAMRQLTEAVPEGATKFNAHMVNSMAGKVEDAEAVARNLMLEAQMIEGDANALIRDAANKREKAYAMVPSLRPSAPPMAAQVTLAVAHDERGTADEAASKAVMTMASQRPRATTRRRAKAQ